MRRITIRDIAERVGTSTATVSKVLTGRGDHLISEATRQRIREVARELGYSPNLAARALVTGRTHCIALWAETLADFHAMVANTFMDVLRPSRYEIIITDVVKHPDWHAYFERSTILPVEGIIALDSPQSVNSYLSVAGAQPVPLVSAGAYYVSHTDHVGVDLAHGVVGAVRHLAEEGARRIAHLTCRHGLREGDTRRLAYEAAMTELGREPELVTAEESSREDGRKAVLEYAAEKPLPDALVCFNDEMAIGAYKALSELGIRIPEDVALTGCDGIADTAYFPVPITTIVQPVEAMCRTAWEFLRNRIENPETPLQSLILPAELCIRASSRRR